MVRNYKQYAPQENDQRLEDSNQAIVVHNLIRAAAIPPLPPLRPNRSVDSDYFANKLQLALLEHFVPELRKRSAYDTTNITLPEQLPRNDPTMLTQPLANRNFPTGSSPVLASPASVGIAPNLATTSSLYRALLGPITIDGTSFGWINAQSLKIALVLELAYWRAVAASLKPAKFVRQYEVFFVRGRKNRQDDDFFLL